MNRIARRPHLPALLRGSLMSLLLLLLPAFAPAQPQVPLDPALIPKFATPLPLPGVLDGTATSGAAPLVVRMSEFQQRILPDAFYAALPAPYDAGTYVWGYNGSFPGPTIVARRGIPTHVRYVNDLYAPLGGPLFLQRTLPVDQTLHWANPLGEHHQTTPYLGTVPAVVHLHGGEVPSAFDGGPDAWWTPDGIRGPGFVTDQYVYPNEQQAATMFYHDHALGTTRLNVYAGLAGFYLLLDPDGEPVDLPGGPADAATDQYGNPYQIGLAIQDRMFDTNGQLYFPSVGINPEHPFWLPEFFGDVILVNGKPWPYLQVEPRRYRFRFLNGSNARAYEMRLTDRTLKTAGPAFWQIGSDGGLLDAPVKLNDPALAKAPRLLMASGERTDVVIDFSGYAGQTLTLVNSAKSPYPKGAAPDPKTSGVIMQFRVGTTVTGGVDPSLDPSTVTTLRPVPIERFAAPPVKRALTLNEDMGAGGPLAMFVNNTMWNMMPTENIQVGDTEVWEIINLTADTHPIHLHLFQYQLLNRQAFNVSKYLSVYGMPMPGMGPPLAYDVAAAATGFKLGGNPDVTPYLQGPVLLPDANERGWKDTFRMNPGEVTRILVRAAPQDAAERAAAASPPVVAGAGVNLFGFEPWVPMGQTDSFGYPGGPGYVWHCHIIDHEDNEMMRQLVVTGPTAPAVALADRVTTAATAPIPSATAGGLSLAASRPNPTHGPATIEFALPSPTAVELRVFDVTGKVVATLADAEFAAGRHAVVWDGRGRDGGRVPEGTYFYRLRTPTESLVRKLAVVR